MRDQRKRLTERNSRRAALAILIICTSTLAAQEIAGRTSITTPSPSDANSSETDRNQTNLRHSMPPLPLQPSQSVSGNHHPFFKELQSTDKTAYSDSGIQLTSGLGEMIRQTAKQREIAAKPVEGDASRLKSKTLFPASMSSRSVERGIEENDSLHPRQVRRIIPADSETIDGPRISRLSETVEAAPSALLDQNAESSVPGKAASLSDFLALPNDFGTVPLDAVNEISDAVKAASKVGSASEWNGQDSAEKINSDTIDKDSNLTGVADKMLPTIVETRPNIRNVLPLPATVRPFVEQPQLVDGISDPLKEASSTPILFSLSDHSDTKSEMVQSPTLNKVAKYRNNKVTSSAVTFSLTDARPASPDSTKLNSRSNAVASAQADRTALVKPASIVSPDARTPNAKTPGATESVDADTEPVQAPEQITLETTEPVATELVTSEPVGTESADPTTSTSVANLTAPQVETDEMATAPAGSQATQDPIVVTNSPEPSKSEAIESTTNTQKPKTLAGPGIKIISPEIHPLALRREKDGEDFKNNLATGEENSRLKNSELKNSESAEQEVKQEVRQEIEQSPPPNPARSSDPSPVIEEETVDEKVALEASELTAPIAPTELTAPIKTTRQHAKTRDAIVNVPKPWSLAWLLANSDPATESVSSPSANAYTSQPRVNPALENADIAPAVNGSFSKGELDHEKSNVTLNRDQPLTLQGKTNVMQAPDLAGGNPTSHNREDSIQQLETPTLTAQTRASLAQRPQDQAVVVETPSQPIEESIDTQEVELVEKPGAFDETLHVARHRISPVAISAKPVKLESPAQRTVIEGPVASTSDQIQAVVASNRTPSMKPKAERFAPHVKRTPLYMKRAQVRSLTVAGNLKDVRIVDTSICQAIAVGPDRLKLIGGGNGITELIVWAETNDEETPLRMRVFEIHVDTLAPEVSEGGRMVNLLHQSIHHAFPDCRIQISPSKGELIVSGVCNSQESAEKIIRMVRNTCLVTVHDRLMVK